MMVLCCMLSNNQQEETIMATSQREIFKASKWSVEYDEELEVDVTHSFGDLAIVVIRIKK